MLDEEMGSWHILGSCWMALLESWNWIALEVQMLCTYPLEAPLRLPCALFVAERLRKPVNWKSPPLCRLKGVKPGEGGWHQLSSRNKSSLLCSSIFEEQRPKRQTPNSLIRVAVQPWTGLSGLKWGWAWRTCPLSCGWTKWGSKYEGLQLWKPANMKACNGAVNMKAWELSKSQALVYVYERSAVNHTKLFQYSRNCGQVSIS